MSLTNAQKAALHADMLTHPELSTAMATGDDITLANFYNALANPNFVVWRNSVPLDEIMQNGFDWVQVDNLSAGKARIWEWLFANNEKSINPSKTNVRAGISECWKGTTAMVAVRDAVLVHCKRNATVLEKLLSTGTGTDADPAVMGWEGIIGYAETSEARVWQ